MDLVPEAVIDTMTITGTPEDCASRMKDYEGVADEIIMSRLAQRDEHEGMAAYDDLLELVDRVGAKNQNV